MVMHKISALVLSTLVVMFAESTAKPACLPSQVAAEDLQVTVTELKLRVDALERRQKELLARIDQLQEQRIRELTTLLEMRQPKSPVDPSLPAEVAAVATEAVPAEPSDSAASDPADNVATVTPTAPAVIEEPRSPATPFVEYAKELIEEDKYETAARILSSAVDLDPNLDEAYFHRGVVRHLMERYESAVEDFQTAIALTESQPMIFTCIYNQACSQARLGHTDEALQLLERSYEEGFQDILIQMATDPDLDSLREDPRYRSFLLRLRYD